MISQAQTLESNVVRPGTWLRMKSHVPYRLRRLVAGLERYLYMRRGVFVWLDNQRVRCAIDAAPGFLAHPEHEEDRLLMQHVFESLRPGDLFLDAGSHVGLYAIGGAFRVGPTGRVVAFEPTPETVAKLVHNLQLNHLTDRVTVEAVALSDAEGEVEFMTNGTSMLNSIFTGSPPGHTRGNGHSRSIHVRTARLDEFLDPSRRTVAKIDTEGHELEVLRGAPRLMASSARVYVELHPWAWTSEADTWAQLHAICRQTNREIRLLDGTELVEPAHRRVELVRRTGTV